MMDYQDPSSFFFFFSNADEILEIKFYVKKFDKITQEVPCSLNYNVTFITPHYLNTDIDIFIITRKSKCSKNPTGTKFGQQKEILTVVFNNAYSPTPILDTINLKQYKISL